MFDFFWFFLFPRFDCSKLHKDIQFRRWIVALILSHPYACVNSVVIHLKSTLTNEYFMEWHVGAHTDCPFEYGFGEFRWQKCWKVTFYLRRVNEERRLISRQFLKWLGIPSSKQTCLLWRIAVETDGPRIIDDHHRVALNQLWILICPDMTRYDPSFLRHSDLVSLSGGSWWDDIQSPNCWLLLKGVILPGDWGLSLI